MLDISDKIILLDNGNILEYGYTHQLMESSAILNYISKQNMNFVNLK